jgi:hypothetical protein
MRGPILLLAVVGATGCSTFQVHRAALGPHTEPVLYSAEPSEGIAEIGVGASSVAHFKHLSDGNPDSAVEVPGTQARGDVRFQLNDAIALGLAYENGIAATSQQPKRTQPPVENGDVQGVGILTDVSIKTNDPNLIVGLHVDMTIWQVPWVEYITCSTNCGGESWTIQTHGKDTVGTFAFAVTPSYRSGPVTWFGGLTARQHPTIQEKDTEVLTDLDGDVRSGPFNLILSVGLEAKLGPMVKGSLVLYQDLVQDPVTYGPAIGAMVIVPLGKRHKPAPVAAPVYAPTPAGPPQPPGR